LIELDLIIGHTNPMPKTYSNNLTPFLVGASLSPLGFFPPEFAALG